MFKARHFLKQIPALTLLLLFIGGWLTVPVSLAAPEPITCGMECCEESGVCCCLLSRQALTHEEEGDTEQESQLFAWPKSCPSNCAVLPSFSHHWLAQKSLPSLLRIELTAQAVRLVHQAIQSSRLELCRRSVPRAPPVFS